MRRAVHRLPAPPDLALIDGNQRPPLDCPMRCVIGGDALSLSIAAASIVAKVVRDRAMARLAIRFPGYGWEHNAGYATEDEIAVATGGHAFYSNNDLKDALTAATETGSSYYTLSYSPTNQNYDGQLRKLRVELSKHGYHLAYRRAYYGYNPDLPAPPRGNRRSDPSQPPAVRDSLFWKNSCCCQICCA